ncbi:hypothetical protein FHS61_001606 [Altererythrobacter atlanticus]|uniref:Uncharacterized protein n=1 Tax=Croceibacterium atlanticum TaxID=1267766 RepID=A0A0F7KPQ4_9SPHN|nr:hypothetical protein [Croceibacterium atlanticum]AKH41082.1 hypothetical protein WYH_00015 [Croceibacterium atlanticum]MBB5732597.1 hypothetical protein [Croceibacterium atlanticum]
MSFWTFIFLIVIAGILYKAWRTRQLSEHGMYEDENGTPRQFGNRQREAELEREVEELRERIQVLERIATDNRGAKRLSDEIDKLRDE